MIEYVTIDDYFDGDPSPCQANQEGYVDEAWSTSRHFLKRINMEMTSDSQWAYSRYTNGIHVQTIDDAEIGDDEGWEPVELTGSFDPIEYKLVDVYESYYTRVKAIWEWIGKASAHLCDAPVTECWACSYVRRNDKKLDVRLSYAIELYEREVKSLCEELAEAIERILDFECEAAESPMAAKEWVKRHDGVPVERHAVERLASDNGVELDDGKYERIVNMLGRRLESERYYYVSKQEILTAIRTVME